jgi:transcriptional regulator with XRE-family HTH domain
MTLVEFGNYLRGLRKAKRLTLREVQKQSGASGSYLSQVEQGKRQPSPDLLRKIAPAYSASVRDLMNRAGYMDEPEVKMGEKDRVEWAYEAVLSDPEYKFGTSVRVSGELSIEAKRFIVEVYEKATGKKLL